MAEANAPGKLVICGEYGVLAGAPAMAVAVEVRAKATVTVATRSSLLIAGSGVWPFEWGSDGAPGWREAPPAGQGGILEAVAATLAAHGVAMPAACEISLDTRQFLARPDHTGEKASEATPASGKVITAPEKLGLGSSAAVVVALTAALLAEARRAPPETAVLLPLCLDAHRRFQGGSGSGVDVATAVHGGVVTLAIDAAGVTIRPLPWPAGLLWLPVWSGQGASTLALLGQFERFRQGDPARFERHTVELRRVATTAVEAWEHGTVQAVLRALADYDDALRALDDGARIGIYTPIHDRLAREAQAQGAVYKVSGAGGGDFGIAFAGSADVIDALRGQWAGAGLLMLTGDTRVPGAVVTA